MSVALKFLHFNFCLSLPAAKYKEQNFNPANFQDIPNPMGFISLEYQWDTSHHTLYYSLPRLVFFWQYWVANYILTTLNCFHLGWHDIILLAYSDFFPRYFAIFPTLYSTLFINTINSLIRPHCCHSVRVENMFLIFLWLFKAKTFHRTYYL